MKQFSRTIYGKTLLFLLCMAMTTLAIISLFFAITMIDEGFYVSTEEDLFERYSYSTVRSAMKDALSYYGGDIEEYQKGKSAYETVIVKDAKNIIFQIVDKDRILVGTDTSDGVKEWKYEFPIVVSEDRMSYPRYSIHSMSDGEATGLTIRATLLGDYVEGDRIYFLHSYLGFFYALRYGIYVIILISGLIAIFSFIMLLNASARRKNSEHLYPGFLNKVPFDLLLLIELFFFLFSFGLMGTAFHFSGAAALFYVLILGELVFATLIAMSMSAAARVKQGVFIRNTLIYKIFSWVGRIWSSFYRAFLKMLAGYALMPKLMTALLLLFFIEYVILHYNYNATGSLTGTYIFWFFKNLILLFLAAFLIYSMDRLRKGAAILAKGDFSYKIDESNLFMGFLDHARDLNSIAKGMEMAVEERLKSERMKTELITNVSHDIKTPLTSIINYSDLIAEAVGEPGPDIDKIRDYSTVLMRQSDKLKRLIEDLVEASKASTGNLELSLAASDAALYLTQISGEYADRMKAAGLSPVIDSTVEENQAYIMADSRRMWRVFENIMNNICKYSLSGTRVYLGLTVMDDRVEFSFKNTSRDALNINPTELFERFTRGDKSRTTDGNGLGLSIAKSLVELQGGSMDIVIDGDLFKVVIAFPKSSATLE